MQNAPFSGVHLSSSKVGYAQSGLKVGNTIATPQFVNIGESENMPLQSIIPQGDDLSDNVFLQTLDAYGRTVNSYNWIDWAGPDSDQEAWADDEGNIIEGVTFAPGQGLCITGSSTDQGIQTAGKVGVNDVVVSLTVGNVIVGNPFPVSIDLQEILPQGDDLSDNVFIQTLDAYGRTVDSYNWIDWAGPDSDQEAWADDEGNIIEGVTFAPGQGLCVTGSSTEQSVRFPAPEL